MSIAAKRFGEFIIETALGEGGMGKVYRARQISLDRYVALKILSVTQRCDDVSARFHREARSAARLIHPNIVQVYTVGAHQGTPYFAMEYIEGQDLDKILRRGALTCDEAIEVVRAVAKALQAASKHNIVHRDIKPGNIMISNTGLVKVMDFGLAKAAGGGDCEMLTQPGVVIGTPSYMAPEQGAGEEVDARADLYSLGCIMYHCLCGRPPFNADNVATLLYKHMYKDPERPADIVAGLEPGVDAICMKLLAKKREDRFQSAHELLERLAALSINSEQAELSLSRRATVARTGADSTLLQSPRKAESASKPSKSQSAKTIRQVVDRYAGRQFQRLSDGRWSYRADLKRCDEAAGLAAQLQPAQDRSSGGLNDCLLCDNWNKRLGCALAYSFDLESRMQGLKLVVEQAIAWSGAGQFDRAIALLDNYLKTHPKDPEAYRELARLYDHPEYRGKDRRRAVVLYQRFADLAYGTGRYSTHEIMRAEERIRVLMLAADPALPACTPAEGIHFQCFFEMEGSWFCHGVLSTEMLCLAKAGRIDPDSGESAPASGGAIQRATRLLRRLTTRHIIKDEPANVRKELARLAALDMSGLLSDPACVAHFNVDEIALIDWTNDRDTPVRRLGLILDTGRHELVFMSSAAFKADQCHELLSRLMSLKPVSV